MKQKIILIVEDNLLIANDIKNVLLKSGYNVPGIATTGEIAIAKTKDLQPDLVIMDISLKGGMDGIQAGKIIMEQFSTPVIYLTGNSHMLKSSGISAISINKPFEDNELKAAVSSVLHKK